MSETDSCGVLYMATGEEYIEEARKSARSVKEHMDIPVAIATDEHVDASVFDEHIEFPCRTQSVNGRSWLLNSTIPPGLSPFDRTLYLDSDTLIRDDVTEVFDLLDGYDLAVARVPERPTPEGLSDVWSLLNCGVIAYKETDPVVEVFQDWERNYREMIQTSAQPEDQPAFVQALHESDVRWYCLPREYNVRVPRRGMLSGKVKIIHGRHRAGLDQVAQELERSTRPRIFRERSNITTPTHSVTARGTLRYHLESTLSNYSISTGLRIAATYLFDRIAGTDRMQQYDNHDLG